MLSNDATSCLEVHGDGPQNNHTGGGIQNNNVQTGSHNTQNNYYQAERRSAKQPWRLPRQAAGQYAGYDDVLTRLESSLLENESGDDQVIFVLSGMGGVGKSEAVLQFFKRSNSALRQRFWAAFWIDCSSEVTTRADFRRVGSLCGWTLDDEDLLYGARDQLASLNKQSLLILDNCDDPKTNFSRYIPNSPLVSVVLTTRLADANKYASCDIANQMHKLYLEIDGLDLISARTLILGTAGFQGRSDMELRQAEQIANVLDRHPLAIVVASSLIQSSIYSLKEYAEALEDRVTQKELLDTESDQAIYRKVSATFEISASHLQQLAVKDRSAQDALDLLGLLAFMHHQDISEDIFMRAWEFEEEALRRCDDEDLNSAERLSSWHVAQSRKYIFYETNNERRRAFRKARAHLIRLALVKYAIGDNIISMHQLVHLWARERLQHVTNPWAAAASILALSRQGFNHERPYSTQSALHCRKNFLLYQATEDIVRLQRTNACLLWCNFAWQIHYAGQMQETVHCLVKEMQSLFNDQTDDLLVAEAQHLSAVLSLEHGEISKAKAMLKENLKLQSKQAEDHPDRLGSHHMLALANMRDGCYSTAIEILAYVVGLQEKLPEGDPSRLESQHELAVAYLADGRNPQAIELLEHVVHVNREKLSESHPSRIACQHNLAYAYFSAGRTSDAIALFESVVQAGGEKLPSKVRIRLAHAYVRDGQIPKAIELLEHAVDIEKETLTEGHTSRLATQRELARAYIAGSRIVEAVDVLEHVVKAGEKLAEDSPERLASQHELAIAYWSNDNFTDADKLMSHVVAIRQSNLDESHPDRLLSETGLAKIRGSRVSSSNT